MNTTTLLELTDFLRQNYDLREPVTLQPISKGLENQNYVVAAGGERFVLRVYSRMHSTTGARKQEEIAFELDFMDHVRRQGVPTPAVIATQTGPLVAEVTIGGESRFAALFAYVEGQEAPAYNAANARAMAQTLLALRKSSQNYRYETVRAWPGDMVSTSLAVYERSRDTVGSYQGALDALYQRALLGYAQIKQAGLARGIVHGDVKLENVLFAGDDVAAVLDFDDYHESYLLQDLARTVMHDLDSPTRNAIRSGRLGQFQEVFAGEADMPHLRTFLQARFVYDVTMYLQAGLDGLVQELFANRYVREHILG